MAKSTDVSTHEVHNPFIGVGARLIQERMKTNPRLKTLCHYTDPGGLLGMVKENNIRFSHINFLNDGSEIRYGLKMIEEHIPIVLNEVATDARIEFGAFLASVLDYMEEHIRLHVPIVFCMSAENDLLNQWRNYGKSKVCYCVEFDFSKKPGDYVFDVMDAQIIYDVPEQKDLIFRLISLFFIHFHDKNWLAGRHPTDLNKLRVGLATEILLFVLRFKDPAFADEKEWRLIGFAASEQPPLTPGFRSSDAGLLPYFDWHKRDKNIPLPITRIGVGPSPYPEVAQQGLRYFLDQVGRPEIEAIASPIPLRSW